MSRQKSIYRRNLLEYPVAATASGVRGCKMKTMAINRLLISTSVEKSAFIKPIFKMIYNQDGKGDCIYKKKSNRWSFFCSTLFESNHALSALHHYVCRFTSQHRAHRLISFTVLFIFGRTEGSIARKSHQDDGIGSTACGSRGKTAASRGSCGKRTSVFSRPAVV